MEVADSHFQDQAPASIIELLVYRSVIKAVLLLFFVFVWFVLVMINRIKSRIESGIYSCPLVDPLWIPNFMDAQVPYIKCYIICI